MQDLIEDNIKDESKVCLRRILIALLGMNFTSFFFVVFPVVATLPTIYRDEWYVGDDVIRLLEPIFALPLTFIFLWLSPYCQYRNRTDVLRIVLVFLFFSSIYQQGAGFHSAANMFKHPISNFNDAHPELVLLYPELVEIYQWIRDKWEHEISHYMYAAGGVFVSFVHAYAYKDYRIEKSPVFESKSLVRHAFDNKTELLLFLSSALLYGLLIGAVAVEFPSGSIVALILCLVYGYGVLGTFIVRKRDGSKFVVGTYPIIHYFILSYTIGLIITIGWMSKYGLKNRLDSGISF